MTKKIEQKNLNMWHIAKSVGLDSILCPKCGERVKAGKILESFFRKIIEECQIGSTVKIKNFGSFKAKTLKARTVKSPVLEGGKAIMEELLVLRFKITAKAKRLLNDRPDPYRKEGQEDE
jgi:nucleoid DNA-binding protein